MEIGLSDDQQLFRETSRRALEEHSPLERVRELIDDPLGFDRAVWDAGRRARLVRHARPRTSTAAAASPATGWST